MGRGEKICCLKKGRKKKDISIISPWLSAGPPNPAAGTLQHATQREGLPSSQEISPFTLRLCLGLLPGATPASGVEGWGGGRPAPPLGCGLLLGSWLSAAGQRLRLPASSRPSPRSGASDSDILHEAGRVRVEGMSSRTRLPESHPVPPLASFVTFPKLSQ